MFEKEFVRARHQLRLHAFDAVDAEMRIVGLGGRTAHTKSRKVLLLDLSPDSLRFKSTLWMPPDEDWTVALTFVLEGIPLEAAGTIASAEPEGSWWTYQVELNPNPVARTLLTRVLNHRLRARSPFLYRIHEAYGKSWW